VGLVQTIRMFVKPMFESPKSNLP